MTSMSVATIQVTAPSRLHFGLLSFGQPGTRQFGGVGAMINQPGLELQISPASEFAIAGPLAERAATTLQRISKRMELPEPPECRVNIVTAPPEHVGLGTGTQLALALAAGISAFLGRPPLSADQLARLTGRGERSAIGSYGFTHGGLLVESGKAVGESLSPLAQRVELPSEWRFVLICPQNERGLSGDAERRAFCNLPPVPQATTNRLLDEVHCELLPAAVAREFERFSDSLYRYGYEAGMCFAAQQGGPFGGQRAAELVGRIRELGVRGVGQSSWGPTLFALLPNAAEAGELIRRLRPYLVAEDTVHVAEPNQTGAQIARHELP